MEEKLKIISRGGSNAALIDFTCVEVSPNWLRIDSFCKLNLFQPIDVHYRGQKISLEVAKIQELPDNPNGSFTYFLSLAGRGNLCTFFDSIRRDLSLSHQGGGLELIQTPKVEAIRPFVRAMRFDTNGRIGALINGFRSLDMPLIAKVDNLSVNGALLRISSDGAFPFPLNTHISVVIEDLQQAWVQGPIACDAQVVRIGTDEETGAATAGVQIRVANGRNKENYDKIINELELEAGLTGLTIIRAKVGS